jgi:hypothetical protein
LDFICDKLVEISCELVALLLVEFLGRKGLKGSVTLKTACAVASKRFEPKITGARGVNELQLIPITNRKELFALLLPSVTVRDGMRPCH